MASSKIEPGKFKNSQRVRLVEDPSRGFAAIFEHYPSSIVFPDRSVLRSCLRTAEGNRVRIVIPSSAIVGGA
jgi:hypothetical protein